MKILTHFAHASYQTALAQVPDVEFYHLTFLKTTDFDKFAAKVRSREIDPYIGSQVIRDIYKNPERLTKCWEENSCKPRNVHEITLKKLESIDVWNTFDVFLLHWHPYINILLRAIENTYEEEPNRKRLPVIFLEHTWPMNNGAVNEWKNLRHKHVDHTVFITPASRKAWDAERDEQSSHIYHSIDIDKFPQKPDYSSKAIMTTTNEMITRDWACGFSLWANVLGVPNKVYFDDISLYGYGNDNIGKTAKGPRPREEILDLLGNAGLYFNPSIMSPVPMSLLEAAAVGTPIVSTSYCEPGNIFKNKVHGIFSNDPVELREGIQYILDNPDDAKRMADNAKKVVAELFNPAQFREAWSKVFKKVCK